MKATSIDIIHIPFSRYGAYVSIIRQAGMDGQPPAKALTIHSARRRFTETPFMSLSFGPDGGDDFTCTAAPEAIRVENERGHALIYIRDDDTIVIDSHGLDLTFRMLPIGYGAPTGERTFRMISQALSLYASFSVPCGQGVQDGPCRRWEYNTHRNQRTDLTVRCEEGRALVALCISHAEPGDIPLPIRPEEEIAAVRAEWEAFLARLPESDATDEETDNFIRITWYNLWSSVARAEGVYPNDTMLMSKKGMSATWSWDHCFNALAIARRTDREAAKKQALDQFSAPFHLQTEKGILPDMWNPDLETRWGTTKPPIHGWCFSLLMDRFNFTREELEMVYTWLEKWTGWWMNHSDTDHDGIPDYPQGCDSGWDNSTLFDDGFFLESPDLPAFLILQMRTLARIAGALGCDEKKTHWLSEAEALMERFLAHSWNGERFVAKFSHTHEYNPQPTSLLSCMPIVLGEMLPKDIRDKLAAILERDFLTENGLATEMPTSEKYIADGYWRGPIWAPSTYLMVDGLRRGGYDQLARTVAERYCTMSCKKAKGNYENFDALTGLGWRAPGYTWSASVYLLLHWEFGC